MAVVSLPELMKPEIVPEENGKSKVQTARSKMMLRVERR